MNLFSTEFAKFACIGDTISATVKGFDIVARIEHDHDTGIDDDDCHSPVQSVTGCDDDQFRKLLQARKAWFNDEWQYCGIVLSVSRNGITLDDYAASLWGIELNYPGADNSHLTEVANELLDEAISAGEAARDDVLHKLA